MARKRNLDKASIINEKIQKFMYQCKVCGRKEVIRYNRDRTLCSHCKNYIYKTEELEKQYKFMEKMNKLLKLNRR